MVIVSEYWSRIQIPFNYQSGIQMPFNQGPFCQIFELLCVKNSENQTFCLKFRCHLKLEHSTTGHHSNNRLLRFLDPCCMYHHFNTAPCQVFWESAWVKQVEVICASSAGQGWGRCAAWESTSVRWSSWSAWDMVQVISVGGSMPACASRQGSEQRWFENEIYHVHHSPSSRLAPLALTTSTQLTRAL